MLFMNLPAFEDNKYTAYDCFHENGPYGEIPSRGERTNHNTQIYLKASLPYNNAAYFYE